MAIDEKRSNIERRSGRDRRGDVEEEKRLAGERRATIDRRSGRDRRSSNAVPSSRDGGRHDV
jgi:hypothetical protein